METTFSQTLEMYVGPGIIVFHIPFTIGTIKAFVCTTPCEGGSIMRVRTWIDEKTHTSYFNIFIAWLLTGVSASQLAADLDILENKIRMSKPIQQKEDGPARRVVSRICLFVHLFICVFVYLQLHLYSVSIYIYLYTYISICTCISTYIYRIIGSNNFIQKIPNLLAKELISMIGSTSKYYYK